MIQRVKERMDVSKEPYKMLVLPDHPTPICIQTHTSDPVPYMLYDSRRQEEQAGVYNEAEAEKSGIFIKKGYQLIEKLFAD